MITRITPKMHAHTAMITVICEEGVLETSSTVICNCVLETSSTVICNCVLETAVTSSVVQYRAAIHNKFISL